MTYRRLMGIVVLVAASLSSARLMLAQEPPRVKSLERTSGAKDALVNRPPLARATSPVEPPNGTIIAGTFEGTFSVGRTRVVANTNSTALVLAHLSPEGRTSWMESFDGLAPGRAVASLQLPGGGAVVTGVFKGKFNLDVPKQKEFNSGDGDGLFIALVTARGRVTVARTLGVAGHFAAPSVAYRPDKFTIEVPYRGTLSQVPFRPFPTPKPGPGVLQLEVSREGKVLSAAIIKTPKGADPNTPAPGGQLEPVPGGGVPGSAPGPVMGKAKAAPSAPVPAPGAPKAMAMSAMMMAGACNVCVVNTPQWDPACHDCRTRVCNDDGDVWCCDSGWDRQCMNEAMSGTCAATPQRVCECPHPTGETGVWMYHQCQRPGAPPQCVHDVCSADAYCTYNEWDGLCVGAAACGGL